MSSELYVKRAIQDVETELGLVDKILPTKATTPMTAGYGPELDQSPELDPRRANYFQGVIGVLRWACELGQIDILVAVLMLSRYLVNPREGHLQQVFHIYGYLKKHKRSTMVFDDSEPSFDPKCFRKCDWSKFYPNAEDLIPPNMPEPRGKEVSMTCFVDADHAGCRVTRRSHTGIVIFVNQAPIVWFSKRQNTVETSIFGSEFVALKIAIDQVEGLRYKLRMMGVPLTRPTSLFCDNKSAVQKSSVPESVLKKKHNAIAYHRLRRRNHQYCKRGWGNEHLQYSHKAATRATLAEDGIISIVVRRKSISQNGRCLPPKKHTTGIVMSTKKRTVSRRVYKIGTTWRYWKE
jgi:hypothetical protein